MDILGEVLALCLIVIAGFTQYTCIHVYTRSWQSEDETSYDVSGSLWEKRDKKGLAVRGLNNYAKFGHPSCNG